MGLRDLLMNHGMAEGGLDLPDVLNALAKGAVLVDVRTAREYEACLLYTSPSPRDS